MGKNTMMKRSIRLFCERTGNEEWPGLVESLVGNVGLIFTKGDLNDVSCLFGNQLQMCDFCVATKVFPRGIAVAAAISRDGADTSRNPAVLRLPVCEQDKT